MSLLSSTAIALPGWVGERCSTSPTSASSGAHLLFARSPASVVVLIGEKVIHLLIHLGQQRFYQRRFRQAGFEMHLHCGNGLHRLQDLVGADVVHDQAMHLLITGSRTIPEALLRLVSERWSIESWHWIRDTQLDEDGHLYKGNGAGVVACLRTAGTKLLRFNRSQ